MIDFQAPLAGMESAAASLDRAAVKIANSAATPSGDTLDLSDAVVQMIEDRNSFAANVKSAQTIDETQQSLLNIVA